MGKKLTEGNDVGKSENSFLTNQNEYFFKLAICEPLDNGFCFKKLKSNNLKEFQHFINETVGRGLTVTEVDKLFLRKKGDIKRNINGRDVIHYGKDRKKFRIFGYYDEYGYFVIKRIDPNHKTDDA